MQAVILALAALSAPLLIGSAAFGYMAPGGKVEIARHVTVALITTGVVLLSHTITVFYFVGTGSAIERETEERGIDSVFSQKARQFRRRLFPWALAAIFLTMGAAMLGGAVHVGLIPSLVHHVLALLALAANGVALSRVPGALILNNRLLDEAAMAEGSRQPSREEPPG